MLVTLGEVVPFGCVSFDDQVCFILGKEVNRLCHAFVHGMKSERRTLAESLGEIASTAAQHLTYISFGWKQYLLYMVEIQLQSDRRPQYCQSLGSLGYCVVDSIRPVHVTWSGQLPRICQAPFVSSPVRGFR